jgi:3-phosphoshikimate 1-carboxyvinyltransferase
MAEGLTQLGISNTVHADGITVIGGDIDGGVIATHHDHRIAMSFRHGGTTRFKSD